MRHLRSILVIMVVFCLGSIDGDSHQTETTKEVRQLQCNPLGVSTD